jgi:uncharacterized membrane-anchored protein
MVDLIPSDGGDSTLVILLISGVSMYLAHDYAHQIYGASVDAIGSVGIVVFAVAVVGTWLGLATAGSGFGS